MVYTILLFIIETLFFVIFNAFLYESIEYILNCLGIAYYLSYQVIDIIIVVINYLVGILVLIILPQYSIFAYYYLAITTLTLILFAL